MRSPTRAPVKAFPTVSLRVCAAASRSARVLSRSRLANPARGQAPCSSAFRSHRERLGTAAPFPQPRRGRHLCCIEIHRRHEPQGAPSSGRGRFLRSLKSTVDTVLQRCRAYGAAVPFWVPTIRPRSTREPHAGPGVSFFRIRFPARAAEDCRTPGPADYSVCGFNSESD